MGKRKAKQYEPMSDAELMEFEQYLDTTEGLGYDMTSRRRLIATIRDREGRVSAYREVVEFYAGKGHFIGDHDANACEWDGQPDHTWDDIGTRARKALGNTEG